MGRADSVSISPDTAWERMSEVHGGLGPGSRAGARSNGGGCPAAWLALADDGRAWHTLSCIPHRLFLRQAKICADYAAEWAARPVSGQGEQEKGWGAEIRGGSPRVDP